MLIKERRIVEAFAAAGATTPESARSLDGIIVIVLIGPAVLTQWFD